MKVTIELTNGIYYTILRKDGKILEKVPHKTQKQAQKYAEKMGGKNV